MTSTPSSLDDVKHEKALGDTSDAVLESAFVGLNRKETLKTFWKASLFCVLAAGAALNNGFQYNLPGGVIANQGFINQFGTVIAADGSKSLDASIVSAWGGVLATFQLLGQWLHPFTGDRFGRKFNLLLLTGLSIIATIIEMTAKEWRAWLVAKVFFGVAVGLTQVTVTTYIAEVAPTQVRGSLLSVYQLFFAIGQIGASVGLQIVQTTKPLAYKDAIYSEWIFNIISLAGVILLPESPWFYARKHDAERTKATLLKINGKVPGYDVEREYSVLANEIADAEAVREASGVHPFLEIFKGVNGRRTFASTVPILVQELAGTSIYFTYASYFFSQAGLENPFLSTVIIFVLLITFTLVSFWTTERVGRRHLMLGGTAVMVLSNLGLGITGSVPTTKASLNASLAVSCIWTVAYASSAAPLGYVCAAEISTPRLRAATTSFALGIFGMLNIVFSSCIPLMLATNGANWGVRTGYFYAGTTAAGLVLVYFFTPETRNRTFLELDELFSANIPARHFKKTQTSLDRQKVKADE